MKNLRMNRNSGSVFIDEGNEAVAVVIGSASVTAEERAQAIINACNAHDQLVAALRKSLYALNHLTDASDAQVEIASMVREALAAAGAA